MVCIRDSIDENQWTQKLGLTQPRVSDLVNGRLEKFSIDKLIGRLYRIGYRFKPKYENKSLTMTVETV